MYEYRPLDRERKEIRLLILETGFGNDILRCTLKHAFLDASPSPVYETISYVCGNPNEKATIILHGSETQVLATSEAALRCMRLRQKRRVIWIDSICIDQNNLLERGHQVGMMYSIYSQTSHNLIWLGADDGTMPNVMNSMAAMLKEIATETRDYVDFNKLASDQTGQPLWATTPASIDLERSGLLEFFQNPWFSRLWIVQEAALAQYSTCHRGDFRVPLLCVLRVARWLYYKWYQLPASFTEPNDILRNARGIFECADKDLGRFHLAQNNLYRCLVTFGPLCTSDPRDHVYAVIGLWQMHNKSGLLPVKLRPNYTLDMREVFTNATKFALQEINQLDMLLQIPGPVKVEDYDQWPSWVPALHRMRVEGGPLVLPPIFNAHSGTTASLSNHVDRPHALIVSGVHVSKISHVFLADDLRLSANAVQTWLAKIEREEGESQMLAQGEDLEIKIGQALLVGSIRLTRITDQDALHLYRSFKRYLQDYGSLPSISPECRATVSDKFSVASLYYSYIREYTQHRALFRTEAGHIGLGPDCTNSGDVLAILYGCMLPVLLRPLSERGEFNLLGISYVHGIMDGEAVLDHKSKGLGDTMFCIV